MARTMQVTASQNGESAASLSHIVVNLIFLGFWTVCRSKEVMLRCPLRLWIIEMGLFFLTLTFKLVICWSHKSWYLTNQPYIPLTTSLTALCSSATFPICIASKTNNLVILYQVCGKYFIKAVVAASLCQYFMRAIRWTYSTLVDIFTQLFCLLLYP